MIVVTDVGRAEENDAGGTVTVTVTTAMPASVVGVDVAIEIASTELEREKHGLEVGVDEKESEKVGKTTFEVVLLLMGPPGTPAA